jgi:Rhodopirellula transposase DDE domain
VHDFPFPDPKVGKAIPYGVYDLGRNTGWVSVGTDHDTAAFAVATLRRWWERVGSPAYPKAERLLICAGARANMRLQSIPGREASMGLASPGIGRGGAVALQHGARLPAGQAHQVGLPAAFGQPLVGEGVAQLVRV